MEGLTLKTWLLGKKVGSGACSDVYIASNLPDALIFIVILFLCVAVESIIPLGSDANRQYVMKLSPLPQLPAAKLKNKKRKKTQAERNADALYAEHLLYKNHLRDQSGIPYVPLGAYGEDQGYRFLVIERLGRTLETVLQEQGPVPSHTAARLGQEILKTLEQMHMKNILYVDVKPENFMLDTEKEYKVYCVDFGISDRYVTATGKHKEYKEGTVVGTPTFLSLNCHNGVTSSRRDDIESLLYVLIYLMRGDLPWQKASSDVEGAKIKKTISIDQLCASLPREWAAMLMSIRACGFEDRPDYDFFVQQFLNLGGKKGLTTPFEWSTRKTSKLAAKQVQSQEYATDSPVRKRVKNVDKESTAPQALVAAKTKKAVPFEKKRLNTRYRKAAAKKDAAPAHDTTSKTTKIRKKDEDIHVKVVDVLPQDREVFKAIASHAAATAALLRTHGDLDTAETHKKILRTLSSVDVDRQSAEVLHRLHATEYAFLRGKELQEKKDQVSKRRRQLRNEWRLRQSMTPQEGATIEDVQENFPKLFEGVMDERKKHRNLNAEVNESVEVTRQSQGTIQPLLSPAVNERGATILSLPAMVDTCRNDLNVTMDVWNGLPQVAGFSMPNEPVLQPKQALSDMLSKRSRLPHEILESFSVDTLSNPAKQRNLFQTASERLEHDRMTGRTRDIDDDQPKSRNGRRRDLRGPPRGIYHPVNQDVLLGGGGNTDNGYMYGSTAVSKKFVSPMGERGANKATKQVIRPDEDKDMDPRLKSCDPELIEKIEMEIVDNGDPITFDDIGMHILLLPLLKRQACINVVCVNELVIWPMQRPDIFTGLRSLPKGLLLFGPPGTGKTLIGKAIASQSGATFFNISASSLTSKWIGQGEKLVRTLFAVAAVKQPSVIFIDEIDSLLTQRSSTENEASRRMKTEFLVQLDGAGTKAKDIILVVGATNRPQELDEAARRRFVKRLYIPLPSLEARLDLVSRLLKDNKNDLSGENMAFIAESTKGYSGADVRALCTEAAMGPIRSCVDIRTMTADSVRPIILDDFNEALRGVRSSVATKDLRLYKEWNEEFGSFAFERHESS
ncbi:hypothetical protein DD237_006646 [Peronospora effusa]|uniref:Protein kinase domain-containing protein n=1 Tax=Peronospora effusa TaxID=542832 RepID=A0A425BY71_9STRA|nr:hypothetical protein DD237_006646 [Peronospora effusa]